MASSSAITTQRDIIIATVRKTVRGEWKVLILDDGSRKLLDSVIKEDDILEENVTNIEQIENRRPLNQEMDAIYLLSPLPHIVDCLMADFERRRYRKAFLIWTSSLSSELQSRLDHSALASEQTASSRVLNVDFFPRESHLITFRDPWSFPILFHPACNHLVRKHLDNLAQKIVSICVSFGEYPVIRYYRPRNPIHEASVLCSHLARFVQEELDLYAKSNPEFPPTPSIRPRGSLIITDRSMDLFAPLVHELTYQAMVHDVLPVKDGDKVMYKTTVHQGEPNQEEKEMEIGEKDRIWVENRHLHMKDLLEKLVGEFNKFRAANPQFAESDKGANSLNNIKDMLAGLPQFQEGKEAYSLHLNMAQDCMSVFQNCRIADIASVEQSLATGLDEDYKRPKNLADQVVRLLDDDSVTAPDRLRLILQYLLYRDGLLPADSQKLLAHGQLPAQDGEVIHNMDLLGARVSRRLKDTRPNLQPLFGRKSPPAPGTEENGLSRFEPAVKTILLELSRGTLDQSVFPYTKPHLDGVEGLTNQENISQASLRSAKPTWARTRASATEPRQRIILFLAGGATYSESRACYEVSRSSNKDIFLATSHMLTPSLFLRQVGDLSVDKRRLGIPAEQPRPKAPAHLFEHEPQPSQKPLPPQPAQTQHLNHKALTAGLSSLKIGPNGTALDSSTESQVAPGPVLQNSNGKLARKDKDPEKRKKHHFFGSKK